MVPLGEMVRLECFLVNIFGFFFFEVEILLLASSVEKEETHNYLLSFSV